MKLRSFNGLLAILLMASIIFLLVSTGVAKPVGPNPDGVWPANTIWGTVLHMENGIYIGEAWFGVKTGPEYASQFPTPPVVDYIYPLFSIGGSPYDYDVKTDVVVPQHFSWYVELRRSSSGAPENATISSVMENADMWFVPQDFSVVLDNSAQGIFVNLRAGSAYITGLTKYATLYVDNAVNVTISPSSQTGVSGQNVTYTVTVQNTGGYDDDYSLSASDTQGWTLDVSPSPLSVPAGSSDIATLTVTLGSETDTITVTADGTLADDVASCTVTTTAGKQYDLTTNVDPTGSGSVALDPSGGTYKEGTDVTATANPNSGYKFDNWSGDASGTSNSVMVTMNSGKSITAHFRSTGEGKARKELPWTWIGVGIVIIVIIVIAAVASKTRMRRLHSKVLLSIRKFHNCPTYLKSP